MTTVWLVEDDATLRDVLCDALRGDGFDVAFCQSVAQVPSHVATRRDSVAIVDGWGRTHLTLAPDVRSTIRQVAASVPTIVVTGRAWSERETASDLGVLALMTKPIDLDDLLDAVHHAALLARA